MKKNAVYGLLFLAGILFTSSIKFDFFEISKQLEIYNTVFKNISMNYVEKTEPSRLMKTSVSKMLSSLDPYTTYSSCLLYTSPSPRDRQKSRMPSSA